MDRVPKILGPLTILTENNKYSSEKTSVDSIRLLTESHPGDLSESYLDQWFCGFINLPTL